jgi:hypothetical protein
MRTNSCLAAPRVSTAVSPVSAQVAGVAAQVGLAGLRSAAARGTTARASSEMEMVLIMGRIQALRAGGKAGSTGPWTRGLRVYRVIVTGQSAHGSAYLAHTARRNPR